MVGVRVNVRAEAREGTGLLTALGAAGIHWSLSGISAACKIQPAEKFTAIKRLNEIPGLSRVRSKA